MSMKSLRVLGHKLIFDMIDRFGDQAIQALMIVSEKFLLNLGEQKTIEMLEAQY